MCISPNLKESSSGPSLTSASVMSARSNFGAHQLSSPHDADSTTGQRTMPCCGPPPLSFCCFPRCPRTRLRLSFPSPATSPATSCCRKRREAVRALDQWIFHTHQVKLRSGRDSSAGTRASTSRGLHRCAKCRPFSGNPCFFHITCLKASIFLRHLTLLL